jgi:hypothetical protein
MANVKAKTARPSLFTLREALLIWAVHCTVFFTVQKVVSMASGFYGSLLVATYLGGHILLAICIAKGRLNIAMPIDRAWFDFLVIMSGFWIGPLWWYWLWKSPRKASSRFEPDTTDPLGKLFTCNHWTTVLLFACCLLLLLILVTWQFGFWR